MLMRPFDNGSSQPAADVNLHLRKHPVVMMGVSAFGQQVFMELD
jgi:hypothetical protein